MQRIEGSLIGQTGCKKEETMNTERANKLILQVGGIDEKITNLQTERTDKIAELTTILGIGSVVTTPIQSGPKQKTAKSTQQGGEKLGDRIIVWLGSNPGKDSAQIAVGMSEKPAKIGLALHHLTQKSLVFSDKGQYFVSVPLSAAAKTAPSFDEEDLNF